MAGSQKLSGRGSVCAATISTPYRRFAAEEQRMTTRTIEEAADAISFRQLRLLESVGRLSSVRQGSEECNLSQPAVTQAIRKLERQLDEALFERRASGSYLTAMGEIFHRRVVSFFGQFEAALSDLGITGGQPALATTSNRISRSQIRSLIAIVEHGSFDKAAHALGLTQASLQRAARDLESNLRRSIFYRTAAGVMVTLNGLEFGRRMKLATQEIEWGIREMRAARGLEESQITIGALPFGGSMLLSTVLDSFVAAHPAASIRIVTEGAQEMVKRLRSGDVDILIGLVQDTRAADLFNESLSATPYKIVCRRNHPLAGRSQVTCGELVAFDWIVGTEGSNRRQAFEEFFAGHQRPRASIATSSLPIVRHLLRSSDRLGLMTSYELARESDNFLALPCADVGNAPAIGVTLRAGWQPTSLHTAFIEALRTTVHTET